MKAFRSILTVLAFAAGINYAQANILETFSAGTTPAEVFESGQDVWANDSRIPTASELLAGGKKFQLIFRSSRSDYGTGIPSYTNYTAIQLQQTGLAETLKFQPVPRDASNEVEASVSYPNIPNSVDIVREVEMLTTMAVFSFEENLEDSRLVTRKSCVIYESGAEKALVCYSRQDSYNFKSRGHTSSDTFDLYELK